MSETKSPEVNESFLKAGRLDLNALADVFEAQGNVAEAKRYRDLAKRQPELEKLSIAESTGHKDKRQQEGVQNQREIRPLQPHERVDASENRGLREQIEKMLQVKSPTSPSKAPKTV